MKKILISFSLLISLNSYGQQIKIFEGRLDSWYMIEGENGFTLTNKGAIYNIPSQCGPADKSNVECKIGGELLSDIIAGLVPKGTKLRIKTIKVTTMYHNLDGGGNIKIIVWKPIEIIRMAK
jgi:hypothetical protein